MKKRIIIGITSLTLIVSLCANVLLYRKVNATETLYFGHYSAHLPNGFVNQLDVFDNNLVILTDHQNDIVFEETFKYDETIEAWYVTVDQKTIYIIAEQDTLLIPVSFNDETSIVGIFKRTGEYPATYHK